MQGVHPAAEHVRARGRRQVSLWIGVLSGAVALLALESVVQVGGAVHTIANDWVYNAVLVLAAATVLVRGLVVDHERAAWLLLGFALVLWALGDLYYTVAFPSSGEVPFPSLADALYLAFYPPAYVALGLLLRSRVARVGGMIWLDGVIAALAIGAAAAAVVFQAVLEATDGRPLAVATNLAYPLADGILLALLGAALALSGWRKGDGWRRLSLGFALFSLADCAYLFDAARGTYVEGRLLDIGWVAGAVLVAASALAPPAPRAARRTIESSVALVVPGAFALLALGVLLARPGSSSHSLAAVLATATLAVTVVRMTMTVVENHRMLVRARRESVTDALTQLGNRRALEQAFAELYELHMPPRALALYDLDGFKRYNDAFGHLAGDALLTRLAGRLREAVGEGGTAFRMGGDEFCVLIACEAGEGETRAAAIASALREQGKGFKVSGSWGVVAIPAEARSYEQALRIADARMYAQKGGGRGNPAVEASNVLVRALAERDSNLGDHVAGVAELADAVAAQLGLEGEDRTLVRLAALVHDVGKMAVPDAILQKPTPLSREERAFVERHTVIGEKILLASPSLAPVGRLVRSSHERWDGSGYPDGLAGEQIPLAARIVFVCDAYDAMVSRRPYSEPVDVEDALAELERCAGAQFDPEVTRVFCAVVRERGAEIERIVEGGGAVGAGSRAVPAGEQ